MKNVQIKLGQFTVLALLGLAVYLKSPVVAVAAVAAIAVKEAREHFDRKAKTIEAEQVEARMVAMEERIRQQDGQLNQLASRYQQYLG